GLAVDLSGDSELSQPNEHTDIGEQPPTLAFRDQHGRLLQSDGFPDARVPQENEGLVSAHEAFADIPDKLALLVDRRDLGTLRVATLRDPDDLLDELLNGSQKPGALCLEPAGD